MQRKRNPKSHIKVSSNFDKDLDRAPIEIQIVFREVYELFRQDPENKLLRIHSLTKLGKKHFGLWSLDVTEDWRAIYRKEGNVIIFIMLSTHEILYGE